MGVYELKGRMHMFLIQIDILYNVRSDIVFKFEVTSQHW